MLEDQAMMPYVQWIKSGPQDAFSISDTKAFEANVMREHFKDMKKVRAADVRTNDG